MTFNWIDFSIGCFLMNAMPHWIFGLTNTRMLSIFGFSPQANIGYAIFNTVAAFGLLIWQYGADSLLNHGIFVGAATILIIYYLTGRFFINLFRLAD